MKQKKSCSNCIKGIAISVNSDIFCREKGAVSPDYVCSRHRSAPAAKSFAELNYKCIDCENFILDTDNSDDSSATGVCQLFSVRKYDGKQKNPCSKFIKKSVLEVS